MTRLRKFIALGSAQRRAFLESLLLLPLVSLVLRWRGFGVARSLVAALPSSYALAVDPFDAARMVNAAAALLGASCLPRSLVLWRLVGAKGAVIRFGVTRSAPEGLSAHAWVELGGEPLNDSKDVADRYAVLETGAGGLPA